MIRSQLCAGVVSCAAVTMSAIAAFGQSINYTSIETTSDSSVQLSYHAMAHKNCTPALPPMIRVNEPPKSGVLTIRKALLTTDKVAGCPTLKAPAEVVFYRSRTGYIGPDHVSYTVSSENGETVIYDVAITVKAATKSIPPPEAVQPL
jgi:hypothetical protein